MKKVFLSLIIALVLSVFATCKQKDPNIEENSPITSSGVMRGILKLIEYGYNTETQTYEVNLKGNVTTEVDFIKVYAGGSAFNTVSLGKCSLSDGNFSLKLSVPPTISMSRIYDEFDKAVDFSFSDTTALVTECFAVAYKNGDNVGNIERISLSSAESAISMRDVLYANKLLYANKAVIVKGTLTEKWIEPGIFIPYITEYDLNLRKGWNVIRYIETDSQAKYTSNDEPSGSIWAFINYKVNHTSEIGIPKSLLKRQCTER